MKLKLKQNNKHEMQNCFKRTDKILNNKLNTRTSNVTKAHICI